MSLDLKNATVIGYFSMPGLSLAEANPEAYRNAMAGMPKGAGSCAHCGTGILHHVVVRLADGTQRYIGTDCAEKVGCERVKYAVRQGLTEEQLKSREAKAQAQQAAIRESEARENARKEERAAKFASEIAALKACGTTFHDSLADAIRFGPLTYKQTIYAVKAIIGRETKKNVDAVDALYEKLQAE